MPRLIRSRRCHACGGFYGETSSPPARRSGAARSARRGFGFMTTTMTITIRTLLLAFLATAAMTTPAIVAAPATPRAAGDAETVITKIDPSPTLVTAAVKNQSASNLFFTIAQQAGGGIVPANDALWDDPSLPGA